MRRKLCLIPCSHFLKTHQPRTWFGANPKQIQERSNLLVKTLKDSSSHTTEFHHAVEQYFLIQPSFKKYYQLTDKAQNAYSVTSLGIKRLIEMSGSDFAFYESRHSLQLAINQQAEGSNLVAVIPASIFFPINNTSHYYAICNIKEHGENHLYIFDSRPTDVAKYNHQGPGLAKHLGLNNLKIYYPNISRENPEAFNGFAYALKDALLLTAISLTRPEVSQVLDKDTEKYEFILPQRFNYDSQFFYTKCFEKLLALDLKEQGAFKDRKNKIFYTHLGAGLTMALVSFVAYQLGHLSKVDEVCKNSLSP